MCKCIIILYIAFLPSHYCALSLLYVQFVAVNMPPPNPRSLKFKGIIKAMNTQNNPKKTKKENIPQLTMHEEPSRQLRSQSVPNISCNNNSLNFKLNLKHLHPLMKKTQMKKFKPFVTENHHALRAIAIIPIKISLRRQTMIESISLYLMKVPVLPKLTQTDGQIIGKLFQKKHRIRNDLLIYHDHLVHLDHQVDMERQVHLDRQVLLDRQAPQNHHLISILGMRIFSNQHISVEITAMLYQQKENVVILPTFCQKRNLIFNLQNPN